MSQPILQRLLKKTGSLDLLSSLDKLSLSELNSLLLEVFRQRASQLTSQDVLKSYQSNRFVSPSTVSPIAFLESELQLLKIAERLGFKVMEFSPLTPLGTCSTFAPVDQNKIVSALRGTEVVSDITNVMALESAGNRRASRFDNVPIHYCSAHRLVRGQGFSGKGFSAHFKIFCAVSAGKDVGSSFAFEKEVLHKHFSVYHNFFKEFKLNDVKIIIKSLHQPGKENRLARAIEDSLVGALKGITVSSIEVPSKDHAYYSDLRFSINVVHKGTEYNIGDGGFVDWGQKLTGNKKERMLTSGIGTELLFKVMNDLVG